LINQASDLIVYVVTSGHCTLYRHQHGHLHLQASLAPLTTHMIQLVAGLLSAAEAVTALLNLAEFMKQCSASSFVKSFCRTP
jgi:hypothetical protein